MFFGGLFYLLLKTPGGNMASLPVPTEGKLQKIQRDEHNVPSFYDEGLPSELLSLNIERYSDEEKLQSDLKYRQEKLVYLMQVEIERSGVTPFKDKRRYENLIQKHNLAMEEFQRKSQELMKKYQDLKNQQEQNNKGLR